MSRFCVLRKCLEWVLKAGVAQLAEYKLPKLGVAGSIPVARSIGLLFVGNPVFIPPGFPGGFESGLCPLFFVVHFVVRCAACLLVDVSA